MKNQIAVGLFVGAVLLCAGCSPKVDTTMATTSPNGRIVVTRIGVIEDSLAYGERRGIYTITDTQTDKEFIGVSGIGISELGQHRNNKTTFSDER